MKDEAEGREPWDRRSGERSIYIVGVSTESGEGRQFTTWRYKEE